MDRLCVNGTVLTDGSLNIPLRNLITDWCSGKKEKNIKLTIEVRRKARSTKQNAYYWGVVVPIIQNAIRELGHWLSEEETHEFLKKEFNNQEVNLENGMFLNVPGSTTDMNTVDFMGFLVRVQHFAAAVLGVEVPDPNEQLILDFK